MGEVQWEIQDGDRVLGPYPEQQVRESIGKGLPSSTLARRAGGRDWAVIGEIEPFASVYRGAVEVEPEAEAPAPAQRSRLIPCLDCGNEISPAAMACPKCGRPNLPPPVQFQAPVGPASPTKTKNTPAQTFVALAFLGVCVWVSVVFYRSWSASDEDRRRAEQVVAQASAAAAQASAAAAQASAAAESPCFLYVTEGNLLELDPALTMIPTFKTRDALATYTAARLARSAPASVNAIAGLASLEKRGTKADVVRFDFVSMEIVSSKGRVWIHPTWCHDNPER